MKKQSQRPTIAIKANHVIDGMAAKQCPKCRQVKPLDQFGIRNVKRADGAIEIRDQAQCRTCR